MAENFNVKIDLLKINGAQVVELSNQHGELIKCVVIPIEQAMLFQGEKSVYLEGSMNVYPNGNNYGESHYIRQNVASKFYKELNEEQRKAIPYIGSARPSKYQSSGNSTSRTAAQARPAIPEGQDF